MKKILILPLVCSIAFAEFTGSVGLTVGKTKDVNNFDEDTIYSIDTKPKTIENNGVMPSIELNYNGFFTSFGGKDGDLKAGYTWDEGSSIYLMKDGYGLEQSFYENFFYKVEKFKEDKFVNPYVINQQRSKKKADILSVELGMSEFLEILDLSLSYNDIKIDDQVNADAKQSGTTYDFSSMVFMLPFAGVGLNYGKGDFDGNSNDYTKLGYALALRMMFDDSRNFMIEMSKNKYDFDVANSYFNKIRDEKETSIDITYTQEGIFGNSDMFMEATLMKSKRKSNINFFHQESKGAMINIGYKF